MNHLGQPIRLFLGIGSNPNGCHCVSMLSPATQVKVVDVGCWTFIREIGGHADDPIAKVSLLRTPRLLKSKKNQGQWMFYDGEKRVGITAWPFFRDTANGRLVQLAAPNACPLANGSDQLMIAG